MQIFKKKKSENLPVTFNFPLVFKSSIKQRTIPESSSSHFSNVNLWVGPSVSIKILSVDLNSLFPFFQIDFLPGLFITHSNVTVSSSYTSISVSSLMNFNGSSWTVNLQLVLTSSIVSL